MQTQLKVIEQRWKNCHRCPLGDDAHKHVIGEFPDDVKHVDILFIGEAPGKDENQIGLPFVGKSGKLLRKAILDSGMEYAEIAITNLIACRPVDIQTNKDRVPKFNEISACRPRLAAIIEATSPGAIVFLGKSAELYAPGAVDMANWDCLKYSLYHPAHVIRHGGIKGRMFQEYVEKFYEILCEVQATIAQKSIFLRELE